MSEYKSSVRAITDFMGSTVWTDIKYELGLWVKDLHEKMEDPDGMLTFEDLRRHQGNIETIRNVSNMPQNIIDNILDDKEREEKS